MTTAKTYLTASLVSLLAGCATCREYPTACKAVVGAVVIGTAISLDHHRRSQAEQMGLPAFHEPPELPRPLGP